MRLVVSENLYEHTLPAGHRFPMGKYRLIYEALAVDAGIVFQHAGRASFEDIRMIHDRAYVDAVRTGTLPASAVRRLGFPWSNGIVERARWSVGGTLTALSWALATGAAGHLAGGTHHAFAGRGEGFCVFNDLAIAAAVARRDYNVRRIAIVDLDVHQGNGTAALFACDPDVFTLSLHGAKNYPFHKEPSCLDVELPDGCNDETYLRALDCALEHVPAHRPDLVIYQAGVDPLSGDRFGRLALTHEGLKQRDQRIFNIAKTLGVPLLVTLGGGYHTNVYASVAAHANVYRGLLQAFSLTLNENAYASSNENIKVWSRFSKRDADSWVNRLCSQALGIVTRLSALTTHRRGSPSRFDRGTSEGTFRITIDTSATVMFARSWYAAAREINTTGRRPAGDGSCAHQTSPRFMIPKAPSGLRRRRRWP